MPNNDPGSAPSILFPFKDSHDIRIMMSARLTACRFNTYDAPLSHACPGRSGDVRDGEIKHQDEPGLSLETD